MALSGVSLVIISHNEERNIGVCLSSVSRLDYPREKLEVIVVDSSSDGTREIVLNHGGVRLIASATIGFSAKRNQGYRAASHELIAYLDADCTVPPDYIRRLLPRIAQKDVGAVGCNAYPPPGAPFLGLCVACLGKPAGGAIGFDCEAQFLERGVAWVGTGCTIYRKSALDAVGGFDEGLRHGNEDVDVSERLRKAGFVLEYERDAFVYHETRNNLFDFVRWAFRRGRAHFDAFHPSWKKLLFEPFSFSWPTTALLALALVPFTYLTPLCISALLLYSLFLGLVLRGKSPSNFPTGRKKLELLIERRRRIGVSLGTILFIVVPLFYLDRLVINLAGVYSKIRTPLASRAAEETAVDKILQSTK
jgi:GT2 family glycosyltransferase